MTDVRFFGAAGDGVTDDTDAIQQTVDEAVGTLHFPAGQYILSRPIEIDLSKRGPFSIEGEGGTACVTMTGPGPAFRLLGSHRGTGDPGSLQAGIWERERLPSVRHLVIDGRHPEADGIELVETMQSLFESVLIRRLRHGIRLRQRNRNVLISHCHVYHNTGAGIFLDGVNLHQINIAGNHISYNRLGGIRIERSEVRNLQITGNDIEYNNSKSHPGLPNEATAEIYVDTTAAGASVNEVTVASNTIQATPSSGGANIRIHETPGADRPPGLWTITGNVIGSQETNVHLSGCHGIVVSGNVIYSCGQRNLLLEQCSQINIASNTFRRHTEKAHTGIRLQDCQDCVLTGCTVQDESPEGQSTKASLLELQGCRRITVTGCQLLDGVPFGLDASDCQNVRLTGCTILDTRAAPKAQGPLRFAGHGTGNHVALSTLSKGAMIGPQSGLTLHENHED